MAVAEYADTARALLDLADAVATDTETVRRSESKGINQQKIRAAVARIDEEIPKDDGIPPAAPANLTVSAQRRGAFADWSMPPAADYVARAVIRVKQQANGALVGTYSTTATNYRVSDLAPNIAYTVEVQYVDRFNLVGPWTAPISVTPAPSVADEVNLSGQAFLTVINGLLPNANLATIQDAAKLGDQIILARAMAVQDAAAINLWVANAAILSAKIAKLTADKIDTGILNVAIALSSTGRISAAGAAMGATGLTLVDTQGQDSPPNVGPGSKITPAVAIAWASMMFFNDEANFRRGISFWADGNSLARAGSLRFVATTGDQDRSSPNTATLYMVSGNAAGAVGKVNMGTDALVARDLAVARDLGVSGNAQIGGSLKAAGDMGIVGGGRFLHQLEVTGVVILAGGTYDATHNWGVFADAHVIYSPPSTSLWIKAEGGLPTAGKVTVSLSTNLVRVVNNTSDSVAIRIRANR